MDKSHRIPPEVEVRLRSGYTLGVWLPPGSEKPVYAVRDYVLDGIYLAVADFARWGDSGRLMSPDKVMTYTSGEEWGYLSELTVGQFKNGIVLETVAVWTYIRSDEDADGSRNRALVKLASVLSTFGFDPDLFRLWGHDTANPLPLAAGEMTDLDCKSVKVTTSYTYL